MSNAIFKHNQVVTEIQTKARQHNQKVIERKESHELVIQDEKEKAHLSA